MGGGKGGVGKSLVSTNLAVSLARTGARVVVFDADLGAPNLHTMFGILRPQRTVEDFLAGSCASLDEIALPTAVPNLRVICGAEGVLGSAHPSHIGKQRLLDQLGRLAADVLLVDVGAGMEIDTIDYFNAADTRLIVMVPEITSLQNGYSFLKMALFRRLQRATAGLRVSERLAGAFGRDAFELGSSMDRVASFFSLLEDEVPELVPQFRRLLLEFNAHLVGNMLHDPADRNALYAMQRLIRERLELPVEVAATLRQNPQVRASVNSGRPFAASAPAGDLDMLQLSQLATGVLRQDLMPLRRIRQDFLQAMRQAPSDPGLDQRFEFGLDGIPVSRMPEPCVREPRVAPAPEPAAPAASGFRSEFRQLQRASERQQVSLPVEIDFDGHGYMGQVVEINEGGAAIRGIRAPATWSGLRGQLRVLRKATNVGPLAIALHRADAGAGTLVVRFEDAAAARRLVAELRGPAPS